MTMAALEGLEAVAARTLQTKTAVLVLTRALSARRELLRLMQRH